MKVSKWFLVQASNEIRQWLKLIIGGAAVMTLYFQNHPEQKERFDAWRQEHKIFIK